MGMGAITQGWTLRVPLRQAIVDRDGVAVDQWEVPDEPHCAQYSPGGELFAVGTAGGQVGWREPRGVHREASCPNSHPGKVGPC